MKNLYLDLETTGIKHMENGILQIAGLIEIDHQLVESFDYRVKPFPQDEITQEAFEIHGLDPKDGNDPGIVYRDLVEMFSKYCGRFDKKDKFNLIGYSVNFDERFLRQWFLKNNDKYFGSWFFWPYIDVMQMVAVELMAKRPQVESFKLIDIIKLYGSRLAKAHDAMSDIKATQKLFLAIRTGAQMELAL